jgi:hypothetical protein
MSEPISARLIRCEEHHWVDTHQPHFPVYWITQCSICGYYNPDRMREEIASAHWAPKSVPNTVSEEEL